MSLDDGLPPLRDVMERHGLAPKKALGQNFLLDLNITAKVGRAAGDLSGHAVLEVGPGPGGLTRALLAGGAEKVVAIERDARCIAALGEIAARYPGRLAVVEGDALALDHAALMSEHAPGLPRKIVANLPYNVATPLLARWLHGGRDDWPPSWSTMALMFQREVAERIVAGVGDAAYGRLGVLAGWRTRAAIAFDLPPQVFTPPPKVTSSVVMFDPLPEPLEANAKAMEQVTRAAFGQRRKMLRQSLKPLGGAALLARAGLPETARAEEIDVAGFAALARALEAKG